MTDTTDYKAAYTVLTVELERIKNRMSEVIELARRRALWNSEADKIRKELGL